jgi:5-methyltetrahydrofolate--homocysteine methyltransferase
LATVKGDVHDIGKNLVDIILSNNGYKVHNLGIKQPLENILSAVKEHKPDAVGLSGLLVKSTYVMKENLETMHEQGYAIPVICGGAALNRAYVEVDLAQAYKGGRVFYGVDAFTGLQIMDELSGQSKEKKLTGEYNSERKRRGEMRAEREARVAVQAREYVKSSIRKAERIPTPPFWGVKYYGVAGGAGEISLSELFPYINKKALYANQWSYRRGKMSTTEYRAFLRDTVDPLFQTWCKRALERRWLMPKVAYGYFPCIAHENRLCILSDLKKRCELFCIDFPRQTADKRRCIADYFVDKKSGEIDVVAFHVVTVGEVATEVAQDLFKSDQYNDYLHFHGLAVETAEALAEYWHKRVRSELAIGSRDGPTIEALFRQTYQGARYSFGYPACPNLEDQRYIFELLKPQKIGVK